MSGRGSALALALVTALGCAPIDVNSEVSVEPRSAPAERFGAEQLSDRDYVVEYVQLGSRLLVSLHEHRQCVAVRHIPVMRVEEIERSNRGFVAWDFALGTFMGGFAALAFARPQLFSDRLIDGQGRVVYQTSSAYVVGGVFAAAAAGLFAAGIVDGLRSRDETRYAEAFELELGPEHACTGDDEAGLALAETSLRLHLGELELDAQTDAEGRARFELPAWDGPIPADGEIAVTLEILRSSAEAKLVALTLRAPFEGIVDAHTGVADTREAASAQRQQSELGPIEGPHPP